VHQKVGDTSVVAPRELNTECDSKPVKAAQMKKAPMVISASIQDTAFFLEASAWYISQRLKIMRINLKLCIKAPFLQLWAR